MNIQELAAAISKAQAKYNANAGSQDELAATLAFRELVRLRAALNKMLDAQDAGRALVCIERELFDDLVEYFDQRLDITESGAPNEAMQLHSRLKGYDRG